MAIYLFFDESGNFDFTPNGTRYCLFGVLTLRQPALVNLALAELRYELLEEGLELECFHASEDRSPVQRRVFEKLTSVSGFDFDVAVIEKCRTAPELRDVRRFYPHFGSDLLCRVLERHAGTNERIVVITDRIPVAKHRQAVEKAFKIELRHRLAERPFAILHHSSSAHPGLQAVDYCTWAVSRKWHRGDQAAYDLVKPFLRSEMELFDEAGGTE